MPTGKKLTTKQRNVIDDLFVGAVDEQQVLENHKVNRRLFDKWMTDENFIAEFDRRLESARRQSDLIIARCSTLAAAKLVQLTESENQETSRKACLDIISLLKDPPDSACVPRNTSDESRATSNELSPEIASRLLTALAGEEKQQTKQK